MIFTLCCVHMQIYRGVLFVRQRLCFAHAVWQRIRVAVVLRAVRWNLIGCSFKLKGEAFI